MLLARIYKPKRRRRGKVVVARSWRLRWKWQGESRYHELNLRVSDRQVAEEKLAAFKREKEHERHGIIPPRPLREGAQRAMSGHLADFLAELRSLGRDAKYVYNVDKRVGRVIEGCGWQLPKDVTGESFSCWRRSQVRKPKTLNDYLDALSTLLNWMKRQGRIAANPLLGVQKVSTQGVDSHRRALSDQEAASLLAVAGSRKAAYLVALGTGLRRAELDGLQWGDVHLDAVKPFLSVRASTTKNGKSAVLWLRSDLVDELRKIQPAEVAVSAPVFAGGVPSMEQFRADLAAAEIAEKDGQGRRLVFHSLRHTLATNLARAGVAPRIAQELMRHSDLRLTMGTYTDAALLPTSDALEKLPWYDQVELAALATGTDGKVDTRKDTQNDTQTPVQRGPCVSGAVRDGAGPQTQNRPEIPSDHAEKPEKVTSEPSSAGRTRTYNQPVNSRLLYH